MSWYSQMFKSYEVARERNRRIQKRLQVELGQKHGPQFVAQYRNSEVNREQKLIEKELERIRKGIHKKPKHGGDSHLNSSRNPNTDSTPGSHVLTVVSPRQQRHSLAFPQTFREFESDIDTKPSAEENQLFQAIILLQTNPSALVPILNAHAQSRAYLDTLERISPRLSPDCQKHFLPRNISKADSATSSERAMLRNKYETLLQRKHSFLKLTKSKKKRKKSPLLLRNKQGVARNDKPVSKTATIVVDPPKPETRVQETNTGGDLPNIETRVKEKPTADDLPNIESRLKENPDVVDLPNIQTRDNHSTAIEDDTVLPLPGDVEQIYVRPGDDIALGDDDKCEKALTSDDVVDMLNFDPETDHIVDHRLFATGSALNSDTPIWERQFAEREHSTPVPRSSDFRPPALYPGDQMQNSREPPRRQSSSDKAPLERKSSQSADDDMGPDGYSAIKARPALDKRISANKLMFPPPDAEMYNPDGSKRTVHNLPDFDASYGEARKARYCRTREMQERDRELSLNEIFDK